MIPWHRTTFSELLGLSHPIIQGPFGSGLSSVALTAAVSHAGGLGSFGVHHLAGPQIRRVADELRTCTERPFNLNLWVPQPGEADATLDASAFAAEVERLRPLRETLGVPAPQPPPSYAAHTFAEQLAAVIDARPAVASFVYGLPPAAAIRAMKERRIVIAGTATTVDEAIALEAAGVDFVVASGSDAGGHRVAFLRPVSESLVGTFSLIPQVVDAVRIPVIAAGGISDGRGIAAALTLGAAGVQVGTAFLACDESNASEPHKRALVSPEARHTSLTPVFTGRLARGIRNHAMTELEDQGPPPPYPIRAWFMSPITQAAKAADRTDLIALWAGQAAPLIRRRSAATCFHQFIATTDAIFAGRQPALDQTSATS